MQLTPCPAGEGPLLLPAPDEVEAELAALAAVAALKAEGNACAPLPSYALLSNTSAASFEAQRTVQNADTQSCGWV